MQGVVIPQSGSFYEKLEKFPVGKFKYWSELLLQGNGEKVLQNLMNFKETSEQVANDPMAMDLIMEGVPIASGERVKVTLWSGQTLNDENKGTYFTVYTVPTGYKVIITDFIQHSANRSVKLAINNKYITSYIYGTSEEPNPIIHLYHEANERDKIQIFDTNYNNYLTIIGHKIKL